MYACDDVDGCCGWNSAQFVELFRIKLSRDLEFDSQPNETVARNSRCEIASLTPKPTR